MNFQADQYFEHLVALKPSWRTRVTQVMLVLTAIFLTYTLFGLMAKVPYIMSVVVVGIWYGVWFLWRFFNTEFEYSLTNGDLDIDRIYGKKRRKNVLGIHVKRFELMARVTSDYYRQCRQDGNIKTYLDFSSHVNIEETFFCVFSDEGGRKMLFFEPTEEMLDIIKVYIPNKLYRE